MDIIFISGKGNKTINLYFKLGMIILITALFIGIVALFVYNVTNLTTNAVDQSRFSQLKEENTYVRQEIERIQRDVMDVQKLIDTIEIYDRKLRNFANLSPINEDLRKMGIGGKGVGKTSSQIPSNVTTNIAQLSQTLDNLLARARLQRASYEKIIIYLEEKTYLQNHTPSIIPVQGWLIRDFGYHLDPFTGESKIHEGLDIAAPPGTPIVAPADAYVKYTGVREGFGVTIELDHGYGLVTIYGHCQRTKVTSGQSVRRGDIIAYVGNTGRSTGPHLHYEVHVANAALNPLQYIITVPYFVD